MSTLSIDHDVDTNPESLNFSGGSQTISLSYNIETDLNERLMIEYRLDTGSRGNSLLFDNRSASVVKPLLTTRDYNTPVTDTLTIIVNRAGYGAWLLIDIVASYPDNGEKDIYSIKFMIDK